MAAIELGLDLQRDMVREHRLLTACLGSVNNPAAPSQVTRALKDTGRQTLIRGSGTLNGMLLRMPLRRVVSGSVLTSLPFCLSFLDAWRCFSASPQPDPRSRWQRSMHDTGTHEGAAVAILESPLPLSSTSTTSSASNMSEETQKVYGIARMVQVSTEPVLSLLDLSIRFPGYSSAKDNGPGSGSSSSSSTSPSNISTKTNVGSNSDSGSDSYTLYVSKTGDLSNLHTHPYSTGNPLHTLTELRPDGEGYADKVLELAIPLWEVVGRGLVIERTSDLRERMARISEDKERMDQVKAVLGGKGRLGVLAGVIARSAGGESAAAKIECNRQTRLRLIFPYCGIR